MRAIVIGVALSMFIGAGSTAFAAASKCDGGITKAEGKKIACRAGVIAKAQSTGTTPDSAKLQKCTDKFTKACAKAQTKGDCIVQSSSPAGCAAAETEADNCAVSASSSPSAAFLE